MKRNIIISTCGVFGSAVLWLISFKMVAVWLGPSGIGLFGQLRQLLQAGGIAATLGGTNAVVQGISERSTDAERLRFRATISKAMAVIALLVSATVFLFASPIASFSLGNSEPEYTHSIQWLSLGILAYAGAIYMMGLFNGYKRYAFLAAIQLSGPVVLVGTLALAAHIKLELNPVMFSLLFLACFAIMYATGLALNMFYANHLQIELIDRHLSKSDTAIFFKFAISTLSATLVNSFSLLFVKAIVIKSYGLDGAGIFDASWTISFNYLTLFLTACSAVYLPALTSSATKNEKGKNVTKTAYAVLTAMAFICYSIPVFSTELITLLYSDRFLAASGLLQILDLAILMRSISWVFSVLIVAEKNSKILLISECIFSSSLLFFVWVVSNYLHSVESIGWAFIFANLLYLCFVSLYVSKANPFVPVARMLVLTATTALPLLVLILLEQAGLASMSDGFVRFGTMVLGLLFSGVFLQQFFRAH